MATRIACEDSGAGRVPSTLANNFAASKTFALLDGAGFVDIPIVIQLRKNGAHAMIAQPARVVGRRE